MTAEIVNLRQVRKRKARSEAEAKAERNRAAHGRSKAERRASDAVTELMDKRLEGHRLGSDETQG